MKWLTREWADRGFSDPRSLAVWEHYSEHLVRILGRLSHGVDALVTDIHIQGAVIDKYEFKNHTLTLVMMTGNDLQGHQWVTLNYDGVSALEPDPHSLDFLIQKPTELMHDELDIVDGEYEHRMLCWPTGELQVRFRSLRHERSPGSAQERATFD